MEKQRRERMLRWSRVVLFCFIIIIIVVSNVRLKSEKDKEQKEVNK